MQLDRKIPFKNMFLCCKAFHRQRISLPAGYQFGMFQDGDEKAWAKIEYAIGDFDSETCAEAYFCTRYGSALEQIRQRCVFIQDQYRKRVATCIAWYDVWESQKVSSVHWLAVHPEHQGKGLGTALLLQVLDFYHQGRQFPVYLHTQPWSYQAIRMYVRHGFQIMKSGAFTGYENQYQEAMDILKQVLPLLEYEKLLQASK